MANQSKSNEQSTVQTNKSLEPRSSAIAERLGRFGHVSDVIEFMGAAAMDAVTGRLTPSAVAAANGSIRLLLRGHELAPKHGKPQAGGSLMRFLMDVSLDG